MKLENCLNKLENFISDVTPTKGAIMGIITGGVMYLTGANEVIGENISNGLMTELTGLTKNLATGISIGLMYGLVYQKVKKYLF